MEGKAGYKPKGPQMGERWHVIGSGDHPILILRKKEVPDLFNSDFWYLFECWKFFHHGFGLPFGGTWDMNDPDIMSALLAMEAHYRREFSHMAVILKYQEAIIKRFDAAFFGKRTRGKRRR